MGVGAFGGISLGLMVFTGLNGLIPPKIIWIRPVTLGCLAIIGAFLLKKFERPLIIFATSITGALLFTFGLDAFLATGLDLVILTVLSGTFDPEKIQVKGNRMVGMVLLWIGMTMVGVFMQTKFTGKNVQSQTRK